MGRRDAAAIQLPLLPGGSLVLMRDGKPTQITFAAFAERPPRAGTTALKTVPRLPDASTTPL
jgi:hypothetical protein